MEDILEKISTQFTQHETFTRK